MTRRWVGISFAVVLLSLGQGALGQAAPMAMPEHKAPASASTSLTVTVDGKAATLTLADLQAMPQKIVSVHNAHNKLDETYSGVSLTDLLGRYGVTTEGPGAKRVYHSYVKAQGTDDYWVLYSASELQASLHTGDAIVALTLNGKPLKEDGQFKLVTGAEKKPARWVRNLTTLTIVTVE